MPTARRPGMDHSIYPYSAISERPPFRLQSGRPVAVYIVLQVEYYELLPPEGSYRDPRFKGEFGTFNPEYRTWSYREYGNRIGIYRVLDVLDKLRIPTTAAIGAGAIAAHPEIVTEIAAREFEVVAHGITANRMITSRMSEDEERQHIIASRDAVTTAFGAPPEGWLSQDFGTTPRTSLMLREAGFRFTLDWSNDEQPYWHLDERSLIALPAPSEWDDAQQISLRKLSASRFPGLVLDALDELSKAPSTSARTLAIGIHPWVFGTPHQIRYLRETLDMVKSHPAVEMMTAGNLANQFRSQQSGDAVRRES